MANKKFKITVTLNNNVPMESVSKMMGHKTLKQTQHYAKILNKEVGEDMEILTRKLSVEAIPKHSQIFNIDDRSELKKILYRKDKMQ